MAPRLEVVAHFAAAAAAAVVVVVAAAVAVAVAAAAAFSVNDILVHYTTYVISVLISETANKFCTWVRSFIPKCKVLCPGMFIKFLPLKCKKISYLPLVEKAMQCAQGDQTSL
jgi:hypothetical protein